MVEIPSSIPPKVSGNPRGWIRVTVTLPDAFFRQVESEESQLQQYRTSVHWWGSDPTDNETVNVHKGELSAIFPSVIRTSRSKFVQWLKDAPEGRALQVHVSTLDGTLVGSIPLDEVVKVLETSDGHNVSHRDTAVTLRPSSETRDGGGVEGTHTARCSIDLSFDNGDRVAGMEEALCRGIDSIQIGNLETLGRESLDQGSGPGWPCRAHHLHVEVFSVCFDPLYAPLNFTQSAKVYLTLGTAKDKSDQCVTEAVAFEKKKDGMFATWDRGQGKGFHTSFSTDCAALEEHTPTSSAESQCSEPCTPHRPILRVGLWKSGPVDQFHNFANTARKKGEGVVISPFDELIGSAVVVPTGGEDGVEVPLYNSDLKKSGMVHLKMIPEMHRMDITESDRGEEKERKEKKEEIECCVDEKSALNYELLSNMDALARHVLPRKDDKDNRESHVRYAMSGSDSDDHALVGIPCEGAVSCSDEEEVVAPAKRQVEHPRKPMIVTDDWMYSIEKSPA